MFEKEIIIASLKNQNSTLGKLIGELENKPELEGQDFEYCQESLRKLEAGLKKITKINKDAAKRSYIYPYNILARAW